MRAMGSIAIKRCGSMRKYALADGRVVWIGDLPIVDGPTADRLHDRTRRSRSSTATGTFAELLPRFVTGVERRVAG